MSAPKAVNALEALIERARERFRSQDAAVARDTPLDLFLSASGVGSAREIADALARTAGAERFSPVAARDPELASHLSPEFLKERRVAPLTRVGDTLVVAIADPTDARGIDGIRFAFRCNPAPVITAASELDDRLGLTGQKHRVGGVETDAPKDADRLRDLATAEPAVRSCAALIEQTFEARASDIRFEPNGRVYKVRFRIDGALVCPSLNLRLLQYNAALTIFWSRARD